MGERNRQACTTFPVRIDNPAAAAETPDLGISCGQTAFGHTATWNLCDDPHGIIVATTVQLRAATAAHTILINASRLSMGVIVADFLAHSDFAGYHPWPNVMLVGDDLHAAIRAILYAAELTRTRLTSETRAEPVLLLVNGIDHSARLMNAAGLFSSGASPIVEALRYMYQHGQRAGVHTVLTVDRHLHLVDPALALAPFKVQIGRPATDDTSEFLWDDLDIGNTVEDGIPGRGLISTRDGIEQVQWFYTPTPGRERSAADRRLLSALRPADSTHPRMVVDLPDADRITSWAQIHQATVWEAFERPDLDPLSPAYRPRRVLPEHLNHERRQRTSQGER